MGAKLILIRHGQTSWNARKIYCGAMDIGLNARGKEQAAALRRQFGREAIDKVYSSDKRRAMQTARIIFKRKKIIRLAGLREIRFGAFEGLNHGQILRRYPELYRKWLQDPFNITMPRGERLIDFRKRVVRTMKKISGDNYGKTVAVVCHGGVIGIFLTCILKRKDFWKLIPKPATFRVVNYG